MTPDCERRDRRYGHTSTVMVNDKPACATHQGLVQAMVRAELERQT